VMVKLMFNLIFFGRGEGARNLRDCHRLLRLERGFRAGQGFRERSHTPLAHFALLGRLPLPAVNVIPPPRPAQQQRLQPPAPPEWPRRVVRPCAWLLCLDSASVRRERLAPRNELSTEDIIGATGIQ
jgi:hypothetical protein